MRKRDGRSSVRVPELCQLARRRIYIFIYTPTIRVYRHNNENTDLIVLNRNTTIYTVIKYRT